MTAPSPVVPRLSAAILLMRSHVQDGSIEVYMVRRHQGSSFVPDVFVFPGGSVTDADRTSEVTAGVCVPVPTLSEETELGMGVRLAAIRELFEEAGVFLALQDNQLIDPALVASPTYIAYRQQLQQDATTMAEFAATEDLVYATDGLIHFAHWITPVTFPKRFDTHFFLAEMPAGQVAQFDATETIGGEWVRPAEALTAYEQGQFPLVFATIHQLRDLAIFATPMDALTSWRGRVPQPVMPHVVQHNGVDTILMPGEEAPA